MTSRDASWPRPGGPTARRWLLVSAYLYRLGMLPMVVAGHFGRDGTAAGSVVLLVVCAVVVLDAAAGLVVLRPSTAWPPPWRRRVAVDVAAAVAFAVLSDAADPGPVRPLAEDPYWFYAQGGVAVVLAVAGVPAALAVVLLVPAATGAGQVLAGAPAAALDVPRLTLGAADLALAALVALTVLGVFHLLARQVATDGLALGRRLERADHQRLLHDTVLQSLEAIVLRARMSGSDPGTQLREVERIAVREVEQLRASLDTARTQEAAASVRVLLEREVAAARASGLSVHDADGELPRSVTTTVAPAVAEALAGALREALTNARRHAGVDRVALSCWVTAYEVTVWVTDEGRGFDENVVRPGFGIEGSISARLRAVGGRGEVRSRPGVGTTVVLTVPRQRV